MGRPKTSKVESAQIDTKIIDLYSFGWTQAEIAIELGMTAQAVTARLKKLKKEWIAEIERPREELLAERLVELRRMEKLAMEEYRKSAEPIITTTVTTQASPSRERLDPEEAGTVNKMRERLEAIAGNGKTLNSKGISRGRVGNVAFLKLAFDCKKLRTQLEGLAPKDSVDEKVEASLDKQWESLFAFLEGELPSDTMEILYKTISEMKSLDTLP